MPREWNDLIVWFDPEMSLEEHIVELRMKKKLYGSAFLFFKKEFEKYKTLIPAIEAILEEVAE